MGDPRKGLDKLEIYRPVSSAGIIGIDQYTVKAESSARITVENAGGANVVEIEGRIGQTAWESILTITGNDSQEFNFASYDFIRFRCTTYDSSPFDFYFAAFFPVAGNATSQNQQTIIDLLDDIANGGSGTIFYGTITGLASATESNVISYTVPVGKIFRLREATVSGTACAKHNLKIGSTTFATRRQNWCDRNARFTYDSLKLTAGQVLEITAEHDESTVQDYQCDIHGSLDDA